MRRLQCNAGLEQADNGKRGLSDMGFILRAWRRIGAKLYLALGFAVLLTLVSSAVGVYYFEQSGDASYRVRTESVPVLEASWAAARG